MASHSHDAGAVEGPVDLHAHFMPPDLPDLASRTSDSRWPRLVVEGDVGKIWCGDDLFRVVRPPCWDIEARIEEMDRIGVGTQVISPIPIALTYWADKTSALEYACHVNEWAAKAVSNSGGRVLALGTVPLQDVDVAIAEMQRAKLELGLSGVEIGTIVNGQELDADSLRPFFRAADELDFAIFIHPTSGDCATRASSPVESFAIGMHTDTALAARALVFGGVLAEVPALRVCLAHGGGSFGWTFPRLKFGYQVKGEFLGSHLDELVSKLYVDALVFDPDHLAILAKRFGRDHIVLGSDYPFLPTEPAPQAIVREAVELGVLGDSDYDLISRTNALRFLGLE